MALLQTRSINNLNSEEYFRIESQKETRINKNKTILIHMQARFYQLQVKGQTKMTKHEEIETLAFRHSNFLPFIPTISDTFHTQGYKLIIINISNI